MCRLTVTVIFCFCVISSFGQWQSYYKNVSKKETKKIDVLKFNESFFNGLKSKSLEEYNIALEFFQDCIEIDKKQSAPYYETALINKKLGDLESAITQIKKALNIEENNRWFVSVYADILFMNQQYTLSIVQYKKLARLEPKNYEVYFKIAENYIYLNNFLKAIKAYDDLQKKTGIDKNISMQKYRLYMELNKKDKAVKELLALLDALPNDVETMEILSELYLLSDQKEKAFEIFKKIAITNPGRGRVHLTLADYYRDNGENDKSYEELKLAFKSEGLSLDIKISVLLSYYQLISFSEKMKNQAYELVSFLRQLYPEDPKVNTVYADILYTDGRFEEAKQQYLIVLKKEKNKLSIWTQILFIQAEQSDFQKMLKTSEEALIYFPTEPLFYYFNGIANKRFKNYEPAIESFSTGVEFVVDNKKLLLEFYSSLADSYHALKRHAISDSLYEQALLIEPENTIVLNNYAYYLSLRKINLERAKQMSLKSNQIEKDNGTYQDTYAWILYQMADYEQAKEWILKALKNGSDQSPVVLEHYGDILYKLGEVDAAVIQWEKARSFSEKSENLDKKIINKQLYE